MKTLTLTQQHKKLTEHIQHSKGIKTVCVSACLSFFGIPIDGYTYTSSDKNVKAYKGVLRRFGYSVRSRKSEFKAMKFPTMTQLRANIKKSSYGVNDLFIVSGSQSKKAHLMVLNGKGDIVIDTAPKMKWRIRDVSIVEKV
jgi:hypothetical protein|tara:strand:- start:3432 stop:3854 length:423 start_codon:yes stop_codon:yes gene_type:complete